MAQWKCYLKVTPLIYGKKEVPGPIPGVSFVYQ